MKLPVAILATILGVVTAQDATDFSSIVQNGAYTTLLQALNASGSDSVIFQNLPVTILGPTDEAFAFASPLIDDLSDEELIQILLDHVVLGLNYTKQNLEEAGGCVIATTAGGTEVSIFLDPSSGSMDVDGIPIVDQDVIGEFGVLHGIESVIIPGQHSLVDCPEPSPPADFTPITRLGRYDTFISALNQTDLTSLLGQYDAIIIAPTDEAFAAANIADGELEEILQNHLIASYGLYSYDLINRECVETSTLGGLRVAFRYDALTSAFSINGIPLNNDIDIEGNFGIMHGIDGVLMDGSSQFTSCFDFSDVTRNGNYNTLLGALEQTNFTEMIAGAAPVTIFGPTDTAFAAAQETINSLSADGLKAVLDNHVILFDNIISERLTLTGCIDRVMEGGMRVDIRYDSETESATINGIPIVEFDIQGNYGVLHGIEGILLEGETPYSPCVDFSSAIESGKYTLFLSALNETGEVDTITQLRPVTLFAPIDEAFAALDSPLSTFEIIINHVIYSDDAFLSGCVDVQTAGGMNVDIRYDSETGVGTVNGIPIVEFNITGNFGVLYGIDGILIEGVTPYTPCTDFSPIRQAGNYATFLNVLNETKKNEFISIQSPLTFFGPTDSAFSLAGDAIATLTEDELVLALDNHILAYPSDVTVEYVKSQGCVDLFSFGVLEISISYNETTGNMTVNGIPVVNADVFGEYGVMHGIDGVLGIDGEYFPCAFEDDDFFSTPEGPTFDTLEELVTEFQRPLFTAVLAAGETSATIFGPDDFAFAAIGEPGTAEENLEILKGHVVVGTYTSEQIKAQGCVVLDTLAGTKIRAMYVAEQSDSDTEGTVMVNNAKVIARLDGDGAVIHGIDKVIFPELFDDCPAESTMAPTVAASTESPPVTTSAAFASKLIFVFCCIIVLIAL
ncbi:unnamed protein product [Cylindrotheca closterium]|uniref:FAS1 domain-containing protein n=1 Tax=Cylindrotheca closterium TaxID=2856 RepID=A0AAD2FFR8_9STRA|nr:unnamed protein product [Cylindrotheca closterium]